MRQKKTTQETPSDYAFKSGDHELFAKYCGDPFAAVTFQYSPKRQINPQPALLAIDPLAWLQR